MPVPGAFLNTADAADTPLLVVTDPARRLIRRGLLAASDEGVARWVGARVLVFRRGPVAYELRAPCVDAPSSPSYVSAVMVS